MKIVICDDEKLFLDSLELIIKEILVKKHPEITVEKFTDVLDFMYYFEENKDIDIVFMDIMMGNSNGFHEAVKLRRMDERIKIIFITSLTRYAVSGYDIKATKYLVKPVTASSIRKVLLETIDQVIRENDSYLIEKNDLGVFKIFFNEILYIETHDRHTLIHTNKIQVISYKTMKAHEKRLRSDQFFRCHTGFIVNLSCIRSYRKNQLTLTSGDTLLVSKARRKSFLEALTDYFGYLM